MHADISSFHFKTFMTKTIKGPFMWCLLGNTPGSGGVTPNGKLCQRRPDKDPVSGGTGGHRPDTVGPRRVPGFSSRCHSKQPACACSCASPPGWAPTTPPFSATPSTCHTTISRFTSSSWPNTPVTCSSPSGSSHTSLPTSALSTLCAAITFLFTTASAAPPHTAASTSETCMCQRPGCQRECPPTTGARPPGPAQLQSYVHSLLSASYGNAKPFPGTPPPHQSSLPLPTEDSTTAQRNTHLRHRG